MRHSLQSSTQSSTKTTAQPAKKTIRKSVATLLSVVTICAILAGSLFAVASANSLRVYRQDTKSQATPEATEPTTGSTGAQDVLPIPETADMLARWEQRLSVSPVNAIRQIYGKQRPPGANNTLPAYYVDINADAGGNGSQESPFNNFTDAVIAVATAAQGLSADIIVAPGTYVENLPVPPNTWVYAMSGYTDTVISGTVALAEGTGLFGFTVHGKSALEGNGKDIVIAGNRFEQENNKASANVNLAGLYNAAILQNAFLAGAQVFGNGSFSDNFLVGGQFGLINIGPPVRFEANVVTGSDINLLFTGSLSSTEPIAVVNNLVIGANVHVEGDISYNVFNNTWLSGSLDLVAEGNAAALVENNIFAYMQTALNVSKGMPQLKNNLFYNNLSDYQDKLNSTVLGINGNELGNPGFVDAINLDFRLRSDSIAIDRGSDATVSSQPRL